MALPEFQHPDLLGAYLRGVQAPGQLRAQQQGVAMGDIQLQQAQMGLAQQQAMFPFQQSIMRSAIQELGGQNTGSPGNPQSQPQANMGGPTGGIQNGPQGAVSSVPPRDAAPSSTSSYDGDQTAPGGLNWTDPTGPKTTSPQLLRAMMLGGGPMAEMAKGLMQTDEAAQKKAQLNAQGPLDTIDKIFNDPHPASIVLAPGNDGLLQRWRQFAPQLGIDPRNPQNLTDANVRRALAFAGNQIRGTVGMTAKDYPSQLQPTTGAFGYRGQIDPVTGKETQVQGREMPVKVGEGQDPNTGQTVATYKNWLGGAAAGNGASRGMPGAHGSPASAGTTQVPAGLPAPSADQTRAAGLAMSMRTGLQNLQGLEQKGFNFTPADRAAVVGVISEQGGPLGIMTGGALSSLPLQELLAHKLSPEGQTYLSALMPVLQGIGHHLGGQRLNDVQIKALLESIAPINTQNKDAMTQINSNRQGYYSGLLAEAGSAREMPVFGGALKGDYERLGQANAGGGVPKVGDVVKGYRYAGGPPHQQSSWIKQQ